MKYAVIESGGKQFLAREGETIDVDRVPSEVGEKITFEDILLVVDDSKVEVGKPLVKGAKVRATVVSQVKGPKIVVFKYKPKQRYRRKQGHRQRYTRVAIDKITLPATKKKEASSKKTASESSKKAARAKGPSRGGKKPAGKSAKEK